mmetsp:Transcript_22157/g.47855  ORF Transcript_22157/g.47855 Transcript_22157/m.47855 type:complete len:292 (-) Transcript_22157:336-1211(-)
MSDVQEKLKTYRQQLAQVEAAIAADPDNSEWTKLRNDLVEVIELTSELAQVKASSGAGPSGEADEMRTFAVGEKCQAIYELDGQWYNAKVVALAEDGYFVAFLGYGNTAQVDFNEVRPYQRPDTHGWSAGTEVTAVHASDGRWYDAAVVDVRKNNVLVRFKGEHENAEVDVDFVKIKQTTVEKKREEVKAEETSGPKLPKSLEVQPDDSEEAAEKKRKKLKMFKRQEKKDKEEKQGEGRRSTWQSFKKKNKVINKSKNFHDPNWDPTRDHGELAARQQMEKYTTYMAREAA